MKLVEPIRYTMRGLPVRSPPEVLHALIVALGACDPHAPTSPVDKPVAAAAAARRPPAAARPSVRSCPAANKPVDVTLDPRITLGDVAGVSWLFGYAAGDAVLAHLGPNGALALTPVPLHNAQAGAVAGDRIWLYAPRESDSVPSRWAAVDITDPDAPIPGPVVPVKVGARFDYAVALAVGTRRALIITAGDDRELTLLDPTRHTFVAPPHALGSGFVPVHAFCGDDRCAVVAITDEGGGPDRRLVVLRVGPDGTREQELLAPGWIGQTHAAVRGDQVLVQWSDHDGVKLRALDRDGRLSGPVVAVPWDSSRRIRSDSLLSAGGAVVTAIGEYERWSVATVGADATVGPLRELPGASRYFLFGAPLDDGLAWVNLGGDVSYDELGGGIKTHSWHAQAAGGFLPNAGPPPPSLELASGGGGGRGGFTAFVLTRPGAAAALVVPRGDADHLHRPVFTNLRVPCPSG